MRSVVAGIALAVVATRADTQVVTPTPVASQVPATVTPALPAAPGVSATYMFESGAGLLLFYVQPAKAADFEVILGRLREALAKAEAPQRRQQALNWKIYRSAEPVSDAAVFVFAFDPALTTASYDPLLLLAEVLPGEVQPLYERLKEAVIKVERMGLTKIR